MNSILIVEDNTDILEFLIQAFTDEGFTVDSATDGRTGLTKALTYPYEVIILDHNLPHKSGAEICKALRKTNETSRVLMLSIVQDIPNKITLLNLGADDYLGKPFVFGELLARVRALLKRPAQTKRTVLSYGPLCVDTDRHTVRLHNKVIMLTPKEFLLLEYMLRNQGFVVSRSAILEHVWGMYTDPLSNTVETHILNLRKKLGDYTHRSLIQTVPGVGYKLA